MALRYKQADLSECSRGYLEELVERLEARRASGEPINETFLDEAKAAIPTAPASFVLHAVD